MLLPSILSDNVPRELSDGDLHRLPFYPIYISQCVVWKSRTGETFKLSNYFYAKLPLSCGIWILRWGEPSLLLRSRVNVCKQYLYLCLHVGCLHLIAFSRLLHRFIYIECLGNLSVAFCFFRSMLVVLLKLFFIGGQVFLAGGCKVTKIFVCKPFFRLLDIW